MKPETAFRNSKVNPFLKGLSHKMASFSVQQLSISGDPDKLICVGGQFVALELKSDKGKLRVLQAIKLYEIQRAGGIALVARPKNWESIKQLLLQLYKGEKFDGTCETYKQCESEIRDVLKSTVWDGPAKDQEHPC